MVVDRRTGELLLVTAEPSATNAPVHDYDLISRPSHDKPASSFLRCDDRRAHWAAVYANKDFVEGFASKFRPLLMTQEVKLLHAAPWGPHP